MKSLIAVVGSLLLAGCGGARPTGSAAVAAIEPGEVSDCAGACDRVARCWQLQYGQADAEGDRAECATRCAGIAAPEQASYFAANGAATTCKAVLDL